MASALPRPSLPKPLIWMRSSLRDVRGFPDEVKDEIGFALYQAQRGQKHVSTKPLRGFGGAGVLEVVADHAGNTFRAVYTARFPQALYVLHAFQKKSKRGVQTPRSEMELIRSRLSEAARHYQENYTHEDYAPNNPDQAGR